MRVKGPEPVLWRLSRCEPVGRAAVKVRERRERKILESIFMADGSRSDLCRMCDLRILMHGLMLGWLWRGIPVVLSREGWVPVWSFLRATSQPLNMILHPDYSSMLS